MAHVEESLAAKPRRSSHGGLSQVFAVLTVTVLWLTNSRYSHRLILRALNFLQ